jgi:GDSL-like Lipase/Acylhydrolase family
VRAREKRRGCVFTVRIAAKTAADSLIDAHWRSLALTGAHWRFGTQVADPGRKTSRSQQRTRRALLPAAGAGLLALSGRAAWRIGQSRALVRASEPLQQPAAPALDAIVRAAQLRLAVPEPARVLLMPAGNVGNAPFFFAPVSWLMTRRARVLHHEVREAAQHHGATYVNLFQEREDDPFAQRRELNAVDGLHPSDAGYRVWWDSLRTQSAIDRWLSAAA